jgi:Protein of unknown function (DUF3467)
MMADPVWATPMDPSEPAPRYSNGANVAMSQWDLTIEFQQRYPMPGKPVSDSDWGTLSVGRITMSPTHAKVLAKLLSNAIANWEANFGDLPSDETLLRGGASTSSSSEGASG